MNEQAAQLNVLICLPPPVIFGYFTFLSQNFSNPNRNEVQRGTAAFG